MLQDGSYQYNLDFVTIEQRFVCVLLVGLLWLTETMSLQACLAVSVVSLALYLGQGAGKVVRKFVALIDLAPSAVYKSFLGL